jgi:pimeloyl-ACP methyl ester carboxylesterase
MSQRNTDQAGLSYEESGEGETVVLVHGGWSDRGVWRLVGPDLARSFRVVAVDRRGHGRTNLPTGGSRVDQEDDLARLIESLGGPATVVGTSFGGSIALGLASRRPDLVRAVVAHEPPLISVVADDAELRPGLSAVDESMRAIIGLVEAGQPAKAAERFVEEIALGPGSWAVMPDDFRETMVVASSAFASEQQDPSWAYIDPLALADIDCPVLLTKGTDSPPWFAPIVSKLGGLVSGSEIHTYEGTGHAPHETHPGLFLPPVEAFISAQIGSDLAASAVA